MDTNGKPKIQLEMMKFIEDGEVIGRIDFNGKTFRAMRKYSHPMDIRRVSQGFRTREAAESFVYIGYRAHLKERAA